MRALRWLTLVVAVLAAFTLTAGSAAADNQRNFVAHLTGDEETPPNGSVAQGEAIFHVNADGTAIEYKLIVANIENVRVSHIHIGGAGVAGPVTVFLYHGPTIPGRFSGVLAEGTITASDLIGPLAGHPLSDLLAAMMADPSNAYVNVHTDQFPGGEIRGQIH